MTLNQLRQSSGKRAWRPIILAATAVLLPLLLIAFIDSHLRSKITIQSPERSGPAAYFEPNLGQHVDDVKYVARGRGFSLFLTGSEALYLLEKRTDAESVRPERSAVVSMRLRDARTDQDLEPLDQLPGKVNYLKGNDPDKWVRNVATYRRVSAADVYPGIDLEWKGVQGGAVRYDLVVAPGASTDVIEWEISGARSVRINDRGDLVLETDAGNISHRSPLTYQMNGTEREIVDSRFRLSGVDDAEPGITTVGFTIGEYDEAKPLVIDPTVVGVIPDLAFSTVLGGDYFDQATAIATDAEGNAYVTGVTGSVLNSSEFPTTIGAFDTTFNGGNLGDAFISKFSADGSTLVYSTYIGGSNDDNGRGIAVDSMGNVYITGVTISADFPVSMGAYDTTLDNLEAYVFKLSADGSSREYCTFLGGLGADEGRAIAVDSNSKAYVTGKTRSSDFPVTMGVFQTAREGGDDAFVTKLNADGTGADYSTYLGGDQDDLGLGIDVNSTGEAIVTGQAEDGTPPFPTTAGAYDETHNGLLDVFVTKVNSGGTAIVYSTFLGGTTDDIGQDIAVDSLGYGIVAGSTSGGGFPATAGAYDETHNGSTDMFVTKMNLAGTGLEFSTFVGGSGADLANGIDTDAINNIYVAGSANDGTPPFPTTTDGADRTNNGGADAALIKLSPDGSTLLYGSYLGGSGVDTAAGVSTRPNGDSYITGQTRSFVFPTTPGAYDTTFNFGDTDAFVAKFNFVQPTVHGVVPDFNGDGITDVSIFRPNASPLGDKAAPEGSNSQWWVLFSDVYTSRGVTFGQPTDIPVVHDFTGDAKSDIAFYRPSSSEWYVLRSEDDTFYAFPFGAFQDVPAPGDFDGDGTADPTVFRPSTGTWYILRSSDSSVIAAPFGTSGDMPVVDDYDGDGMDDIAIYRPSQNQWWQLRSTAGVLGYQFGAPGDIPAVGDFSNDGKADVAFFRPSDANWYVIRSQDGSLFGFPWGATGDVPVPGDYDGDGIVDAGVFRPSNGTWYLNRSGLGFQAIQYGLSSDVPLPGLNSSP